MRYLSRLSAAIFCCVTLSAVFSQAAGADLPGAQDPPGFKRYQDSQIIHTFSSGYAEYTLVREGHLQRLVYLVPEGHTSLEIFRNYEQMLSDLGLRQTTELKSDAITVIASYFFEHVFFGPEKYDATNTPAAYVFSDHAGSPYYAVYQGAKDGKNTTAAVLVGQAGEEQRWKEPGTKFEAQVKKDQVVVTLDVVTGQAVANKMVLVKAEDMASSIAKTGKIDLYGIYFDIDKSDIKPESNDTLGELAKLLKSNASLKLEVSGHTDNTGSHDHNMKLSQARAAAVVKALTTGYGIDGKRLVAKGYGETKPVAPNTTDDGRAKNRRVALRKI
jgi:outer membrane protein OmpA-like peptidoglycan-associated protein